jgi:thiamine biosynthesis lipoprotein
MRRSWTTPAGTVTERFPAMGCEVVVILPANRALHVKTVSALFAEWETRLTRFRPDSDLSRLNAAAGRPAWVEEPLLGVLRRALRAARATRGVFDPTLARELSALGYATTFSAIGGEVAERPAGARASTWHDVRLGPGGLVSLPADLAVDLGGIAKGMAVDAALAALRADGVPFALVSAGGDLAAYGPMSGGRPWPVAVAAAGGETVLSLTAGALATSSTQERRWRTARGEVHHLLDPRTRRPATSDLVRATVHAPTCEAAEVAAKAALILGQDEGAAFLERHRLPGLLSTAAESCPVGEWPAQTAGAA